MQFVLLGRGALLADHHLQEGDDNTVELPSILIAIPDATHARDTGGLVRLERGGVDGIGGTGCGTLPALVACGCGLWDELRTELLLVGTVAGNR